MSNVFFYEPFYDIEAILNQALASQTSPEHSGRQRSRQRADSDGAVRSIKPRMDLHESTESNLVIASFELPGVAKEAIQIDVHNGRLIVSADTTRPDDVDERAGYAVRERQFGKYSRTLQLPQGINDDDIKASMENGVLTITFPKSAPQMAPKKITIS